MAIKINNFSIINNGLSLGVDVETSEGYNITSMLLWKMNDFKDYSLAINLNYKLEQINNSEVFIITNEELNISKFEDIYFIEIQSDEPDDDECTTCLTPALGITYNLLNYYNCMLNVLLDTNILDCKDCNNVTTKNLVVTISLLIDSIEKSIELGFYTQAINNINKLKKLCSLNQCSNCNNNSIVECVTCGKFNQN